jgi:hypothetical protein
VISGELIAQQPPFEKPVVVRQLEKVQSSSKLPAIIAFQEIAPPKACALESTISKKKQ